MEDKSTNKEVVTSPSVEFLLKQVYFAHKEKVKGLESEVKHLRSELNKQRNRCEDCKQCKVLNEELRKCKENYLESLSDQKHRIDLLEMQLLSIQQVPVSKSSMLFSSKRNESTNEMIVNGPTHRKRSKSNELEFLHPAKVAKQKCLLLAKTTLSEKENSKPLNLQSLSSVIVSETLDTEISDDADITVIGIYDKEAKDKKNAQVTTTAVIPDSFDSDMLEVVEADEVENNDLAQLTDGVITVTAKHCNENRNDFDNYINSPSLLPQVANLDKKIEAINHDQQGNSRIVPFLKLNGKNNESISSVTEANNAIMRDVTSPSLISPENKSKYGLNIIQINEHKSSFADNSLCKNENILEDLDVTYFPLPITSCHLTEQNESCKNDHDENNTLKIDDIPNSIVIIDGKDRPEAGCSSAEFGKPKNHLININTPAIECSFDRIPKKDCDIKYKFKEEPVRKKEGRNRLLGHPCKQCEEYYDQLDIAENEKAKRIAECSRHRAVHKPPATPENYWELDFPDTPECRARGYLNETQKIQLQSRRRRPLVLRKDT